MKKNILAKSISLIILSVSFLGCSLKAEISDKNSYRYVQTDELQIMVRDFVGYDVRVPSNKGIEGTINGRGHPDFGNDTLNRKVEGLVLLDLGHDKKPVYNDEIKLSAITSKETFSDWFTTKAGINREYKRTIKFYAQNPKGNTIKWLFDSTCFFPIDDEKSLPDKFIDKHNSRFTIETVFYLFCKEGESFIIFTKSDDDLWLFVNGKLAIDQGGCHNPYQTEITFLPEDYGAKTGDYLEIRVFKAERCGTGSELRLGVNQDIYIRKYN